MDADAKKYEEMVAWLKKNRLAIITKALAERNVTLDELLEFTEEDLNDFTLDMELDVLHKKRFIKAVGKLREERGAPEPEVTAIVIGSEKKITASKKGGSSKSKKTKTSLAIPGVQQHLLVLPEEQAAMNKLYQRLKETSVAAQEVKNAIAKLSDVKPKDIGSSGDDRGSEEEEEEAIMETVDEVYVGAAFGEGTANNSSDSKGKKRKMSKNKRGKHERLSTHDLDEAGMASSAVERVPSNDDEKDENTTEDEKDEKDDEKDSNEKDTKGKENASKNSKNKGKSKSSKNRRNKSNMGLVTTLFNEIMGIIDDDIIVKIETKEKELDNELDHVCSHKLKKIETQMKYVRKVHEDLTKYKSELEKLVKESTSEEETLRRPVVIGEMYGRVRAMFANINDPRTFNRFSVAVTPNVKVRGCDDHSLIKYLSYLKIDRCDEPIAPILRVDKVKHDSISISWLQTGNVHPSRKSHKYEVQIFRIDVETRYEPLVEAIAAAGKSSKNTPVSTSWVRRANIGSTQQKFDNYMAEVLEKIEKGVLEIQWKTYDAGDIDYVRQKRKKIKKKRRKRKGKGKGGKGGKNNKDNKDKDIKDKDKDKDKDKKGKNRKGSDEEEDEKKDDEDHDSENAKDKEDEMEKVEYTSTDELRALKISDMDCKTLYILRVREKNQFGYSKWSKTVYCVTKPLVFRFSDKSVGGAKIHVSQHGTVATNSRIPVGVVQLSKVVRLSSLSDSKKNKKKNKKIVMSRLKYRCTVKFKGNPNTWFAIGVCPKKEISNAVTLASSNRIVTYPTKPQFKGCFIYNNGQVWSQIRISTVYTVSPKNAWNSGDSVRMEWNIQKGTLKIVSHGGWFGFKKSKFMVAEFDNKTDLALVFIVGSNGRVSLSQQSATFKKRLA